MSALQARAVLTHLSRCGCERPATRIVACQPVCERCYQIESKFHAHNVRAAAHRRGTAEWAARHSRVAVLLDSPDCYHLRGALEGVQL